MCDAAAERGSWFVCFYRGAAEIATVWLKVCLGLQVDAPPAVCLLCTVAACRYRLPSAAEEPRR